jgi:hypothetical protein
MRIIKLVNCSNNIHTADFFCIINLILPYSDKRFDAFVCSMPDGLVSSKQDTSEERKQMPIHLSLFKY